MSHGEEKLSAALGELAASSRQHPSPETGLALKDAFRRHHARRRRILRARITLLAVCVLAIASVFLFRRPSPQGGIEPRARVHAIPPQQAEFPAEMSASRYKPALSSRLSTRRRSRDGNGATASNSFVALPAFQMMPAGDELRIVRLEMLGEDLRLVGAPPMERLAGRRVTADFVVGHDGTPYAVRLVQASF